jgi:hypothetical protein
MAVPILAFLATMGARYGASKAIKMAITKFGKKAFQKATEKMSHVGKNISKKIKSKTYKDTKAYKETSKIREKLGLNKVTKSKPVKKVTELQRVKAQIKRDKLNPRLKVKEPKGKDIIGKVSQNFGKAKPYGLTKSQKDGIAYLNATRGPGHTLKDLKKVMAQTKKRLAMKNKPKKP